ncbi:MAG: hypothetical protein QQW96_18005 [Tychonema bourrellyi B0820]|uniref:hypothetical protein n=1 Tax=Tychonema bourrellyi TaxID=54313 RepID=UPI000BDF5CC1|nr:hypothetical protein [Tychonema bourrellyi]MDQ2099528.1 hypothetical protein [Tychonema bourrellyi B0820]
MFSLKPELLKQQLIDGAGIAIESENNRVFVQSPGLLHKDNLLRCEALYGFANSIICSLTGIEVYTITYVRSQIYTISRRQRVLQPGVDGAEVVRLLRPKSGHAKGKQLDRSTESSKIELFV